VGKTFVVENFVCFAANPETIHMHGSSVYGVLELEDFCFNMCAMAEETREFKTDSFISGLLEGREKSKRLICSSCLKSGNIVGHVPHNISMPCSLFIR